MTGPKSYAQAGVSLETADAVVERLRTAVESTGARGFGAFAGVHPLDDGRLLAASTDGVGTKLILARKRGRLRDCGADLAAHCINDVITTGATPLMLLDYVAAAEIRLEDPFASSKHARLVRQGSVMVIEDMGSTNGTYLNEELLTGPQPLHPGDRIRIGDSEFVFED